MSSLTKASQSSQAALDYLKTAPSLKTQGGPDKAKALGLSAEHNPVDSAAVAQMKSQEREFQSRQPTVRPVDVADSAGISRSISSVAFANAKISSDGKTVSVGDVNMSASSFRAARTQAGVNESNHQAEYKKWFAEGDQKGFVGGSKNEVHYIGGKIYRGSPE